MSVNTPNPKPALEATVLRVEALLWFATLLVAFLGYSAGDCNVFNTPTPKPALEAAVLRVEVLS